jgi:peroxiredoxin
VIEEGQPAPEFELAGDSGETVRLSGLRGSPVYFYPADDTSALISQYRRVAP